MRKLHNSANIGLRSEFKPPKYLQSADEAVALIESNSSIYCHSVAQFPLVLVKSLASRARKSDISGLVLCHLHVEGHNPFEDADLWERGQSHHFFSKFIHTFCNIFNFMIKSEKALEKPWKVVMEHIYPHFSLIFQFF